VTKLGLALVLLGLLLVLGAIEGIRHRRNLQRIPIRIHVNGTRGKSSVARLIAGGLRAGGIVTCAKTTGTEASVILPDGSEYPVYRPAGANIIEQVRIVDTAADLGAQALVVECMALQPLLQSLSELRLVRSTHGVITNVGADHLDVMGPGEGDIALALAGAIPAAAKLFTTSERHVETLERAAADRGSEVVALSESEIAAITDEELRKTDHPSEVLIGAGVFGMLSAGHAGAPEASLSCASFVPAAPTSRPDRGRPPGRLR
jgi:poly-gamma-glutamate synthase PgsB/CapB